MRKANWPASLALYGICSLIWFYQGTLLNFYAEIKLALKKK
jgi:hypothetical protein